MTRRFRESERIEAFLRLSATQFAQVADQVADPGVRDWLVSQAEAMRVFARGVDEEPGGSEQTDPESSEARPRRSGRTKPIRTSTLVGCLDAWLCRGCAS